MTVITNMSVLWRRNLVLFASVLVLSIFTVACQSGDATAGIVQCGLRMQAQVSVQNSVGVSQTHNLGGVTTSGTMLSTVGNSACTGSATTFSGVTAFGSGIQDNLGVRMNSNWTVAWGYSNTPFSACGASSTQGFVPDAGAIFNNVCTL